MRRHAALALAVCACLVLAGCITFPGGASNSGSSASETPGGLGAGRTPMGPSGASGDANASDAIPSGATARNATVTDVADGDTVDVRFPDGTTDTVRLVGVDTPEVWVENTPREFHGVPDTAAGRDCLRRWGHRASNFTRRRLAGANVTLVYDPNTDRRGSYGRLLAYVYVGGVNHDAALVRHGLARVYLASDFSLKSRFRATANTSYASREGLWHCSIGGAMNESAGPESAGSETKSNSTASGASATTSGASESGAGALSVVRVHADATGPDESNLNDEYVVLRNAGNATVPLGGVTVSDAANHRYAFPSDAAVAAGTTVRLHTGSGTDRPGDYYWGAGGPIWNNGGDVVAVRDANGTRVAFERYG